VVANIEELERALEAPWEKWAVFLHPEQREVVTRDYNGPARVAGSAGTGKTVVALHRAVHLCSSGPEWAHCVDDVLRAVGAHSACESAKTCWL
jgi:superfamily I DNA and RNA helicase